MSEFTVPAFVTLRGGLMRPGETKKLIAKLKMPFKRGYDQSIFWRYEKLEHTLSNLYHESRNDLCVEIQGHIRSRDLTLAMKARESDGRVDLTAFDGNTIHLNTSEKEAKVATITPESAFTPLTERVIAANKGFWQQMIGRTDRRDQLEKLAERAVAFLARLNLQDHSKKEQVEAVELVHALMAVLRPEKAKK